MQFSYGDDGLNPQIMEKGDRPVNFARLTVNEVQRSSVRGSSNSSSSSSGSSSSGYDPDAGDEECLTSQQLLVALEEQLSSPAFTALLPLGQKFIDETRAHFFAHADRLRAIEKVGGYGEGAAGDSLCISSSEAPGAIRTRLHSLSPAKRKQWEAQARRPGTAAYVDTYRLIAANAHPLTRTQLLGVLQEAMRRSVRTGPRSKLTPTLTLP